jgi:hypothetical protein
MRCPNSSLDNAWTIERKRTGDPHWLQEGTSRSIWLINAMQCCPQILQRHVRLPNATGAAMRRNRLSDNREVADISESALAVMRTDYCTPGAPDADEREDITSAWVAIAARCRGNAAISSRLGGNREYHSALSAKRHPVIVATSSAAVVCRTVCIALSNSFNSAVPAFALFVGAFYACARGLGGSRVAMSVLALVGIVERQSNVFLLPALSDALLTTGRLTMRRIGLAALPAVSGFACLMAYGQWLAESGRRPLLYGLQIEMLFETFRSGTWAAASVDTANLGDIFQTFS